MLHENASRGIEKLARMLKAAGFARSQSAIRSKLKRIGADREDPDTWKLNELSRLTGHGEPTLRRWLQNEGLKHTVEGGAYRIRRKDFRSWIQRTGAELIDLRKVDQVWFKDVMWGAA